MPLPEPLDPATQEIIGSSPGGPSPLHADLPPKSRPVQKDPDHIGPYRVIEKLGEGGMGVVYKAEQRQPVRRLVAMKVIKLGMDTKEVVARFEAERQALALMDHPNVAKVLDAGATDNGRPFFAMEFVPGVPLTAYCQRNKLSTKERLELFIPVCHAIQHAHQKGIIHRDLKPSNILVTLFDGKPVPKVIDFGIAKATNQHLSQHTLYTQTGSLIGTPEYMSPEQAQTGGLDVDTRTDIYSLGVILYELLTGTLPFDADQLRKAGPDGMARIIQETEPQRPSTRLTTLAGADKADATQKPARTDTRDPRTLSREIRGDLDWITLKAMEKDRTRRYETANGLAMDLRRHLDNEPVLARPPSAGYRLSKFARKHRAGVAASVAVVLALVAGLAALTFGMIRARQERDNAARARAEEERQRQTAEKATEQANAATRFLRDMFALRGDTPEARRRLAAASHRLDDGWLRDQPDTQAAIRTALGFCYLRIALNDEAQREFEAGIRLDRQSRSLAGGADSLDQAPALEGLGYTLWNKRDLPAAERYLRQAVESYRLAGDDGQQLVAELLEYLARLRDMQSDPAGARRLRLQVLTENAAVASRQIAAEPGKADAYRERSSMMMRQGLFKEALPDIVLACELDPTEHWNFYYRTLLHLYLEDDAAYRQSARQMYDRFIKSDKREVGDRTAKVCLITTQPVGELAELSRAVDRALAPGTGTVVANLPWFRMAKALLEYRQGHYADAIDYAEKARTISDKKAQATLDCITAMAHFRLAHDAEARQWLTRCLDRIEHEVPKPGEDDLDAHENYMACIILRREAEGLITPTSPATRPATRPAAP